MKLEMIRSRSTFDSFALLFAKMTTTLETKRNMISQKQPIYTSVKKYFIPY